VPNNATFSESPSDSESEQRDAPEAALLGVSPGEVSPLGRSRLQLSMLKMHRTRKSPTPQSAGLSYLFAIISQIII